MFPLQLRPNLKLRVLEPRMADEVFAMVDANRQHLRPWLPWVDKTNSVDDTKAFIDKCMKQLGENNGIHCGIWLDEKYVGGIGMHYIKWEARRTELGYCLAESAQGRGIMTECCRAVIDHCIGTWNLNRIEIRAVPANRRSCAVAERLGFKLDGVLRDVALLHDKFVDLAVYSLLAREWKSHPPR